MSDDANDTDGPLFDGFDATDWVNFLLSGEIGAPIDEAIGDSDDIQAAIATVAARAIDEIFSADRVEAEIEPGPEGPYLRLSVRAETFENGEYTGDDYHFARFPSLADLIEEHFDSFGDDGRSLDGWAAGWQRLHDLIGLKLAEASQ